MMMAALMMAALILVMAIQLTQKVLFLLFGVALEKWVIFIADHIFILTKDILLNCQH